MSNRKGKRSLPSEIYLLPDVELWFVRVSKYTIWSSNVWRWPSVTAGQTDPSFNWELRLAEPVREDTRWKHLLGLGKRFLFSLSVNGMRGQEVKPAHLCNIGSKTRSFLWWMYNEGYSSFAEVGPSDASEYVKHIAGQLVEDDDSSSKKTTDTLAQYIDVLARIYEQGAMFDALPQMQMRSHPLAGHSALKVASEYWRSERGTIPAVPDAVHKATLNEALTWMHTKSQDVERLNAITCEIHEQVRDWQSNNCTTYINRRIVGFRFDLNGSLTTPWREPIKEMACVTRESESGVQQLSWPPALQVRNLLNCTRDAGCIVLHATVGIRVSEVAGLLVHPRGPEGWPRCVSMRLSSDGLKEIFYITGRKYKGSEEYEDTEWVAGVRPVGTKVLPEPIHAILVIDRLFDYWRSLAGSNALIVSLGNVPGLPRRSTTMKAITSNHLIESQKRFLREHVVLDERYADWNLTTHQWRKKFAHDMIRIEPNALPSIREHFKHLSSFVTDTAYLGTSLSLLKVVEDERLRQASRVLLNVVTGEQVVVGKMAPIILKEIELLRTRCEAAANDNERLDIVHSVVKSTGVRAWRCEYGTCLFRSKTAKCHFIRKGAFDPDARRPLGQERTPDVCCTCANLVIDEAHIPFWKARYLEHRGVRDEARNDGDLIIAAFAHERMSNAAAILRMLGCTVEEIEFV
jgi:hypothetical protein